MASTRRAVPPVTAHAGNRSTGDRGAPVPADDRFLTVGDVAERVRVHPQTVRQWIARRELRAIRIGRVVRIPRTEFEEMLERSRIAPAIRPQPVTAQSRSEAPPESPTRA
jgi:excisionase family DNA binding protein